MKKNTISIIAIAALTLGASSCKKWLDVNDNPNIANNPDIALVLPSAQAAVASVMGTAFQINGSFWAQHWTQSPLANQYKLYDQYQVSSDNYNRPWRNIYANGLYNFKYIANKAKADGKKQYEAIAKLMQAYTFQVLTDAFGDIPFNDALKGSVADGLNTSPKYDSQEKVYEGIVSLINEATALIDVTDAAHPGTDDLVFGGDMSHWLEFANTLKLKVGMRLSEKDPAKAEAIIKSISGDFLSASARVKYTNLGGSENPLYSEMVGLSRTTNIFSSKTCVDSMNAIGHPLVYLFYHPLGNGSVVGLPQGDFANSTSATGKSIGGYGVGADPNDTRSAAAPVVFMSVAESDYLQAEAIARGWLTGDEYGLFNAALRAGIADYSADIATLVAEEYIDLTAYGNADADINDYCDSIAFYTYPAGAIAQDRIAAIINQKWMMMSGNQGFEAWTEWRRTGYPVLKPSIASLLGAGKFPARFVYPTDEINLNKNYPGTKLIDQKVWWDAN